MPAVPVGSGERPGGPIFMAVVFDPFGRDWRDDPYPTYRRLRDEAPVHHSAERGVWSVTRFDDVMGVLKNPDIFSSRAMFTMLMSGGNDEGLPPLSWGFVRFLSKMIWKTHLNPLEFRTARNLIAEDGESHTALRAIVNRGFTPRRVADWEGRIRELVEQGISRLRRGESFDVIRDLAVPVPVTVIAEMLGVPSDRIGDFKHWSDTLIEFTTGAGRDDPFGRKYTDVFIELILFLKQLTRERRGHPAEDVISAIVAEQDGAVGLTDREVIQFVMLLLVAGNETTTNLIGNIVDALLDRPHVTEQVAADPSLVPALVEEGLRFDTPVQVVFRTTTQDAEIRGVRIPKKEFVAVFLGSANRDERRFPDPDRLDVTRDPQPFPGFGFGKHFCLGASLARLETRIALEALVPELPRLARVEEHVARIDSFLVRGPQRLELRAA
jgi:cytochrome P450